MDFELTADQRLFRSTTREFLEKEMPLTRVRELAERGVGFERDWWRRGSELGWNSVTVAPEAGGDDNYGVGLVYTCHSGEENGRLASPGALRWVYVCVASVLLAADPDLLSLRI